jgi:hypothetical protein
MIVPGIIAPLDLPASNTGTGEANIRIQPHSQSRSLSPAGGAANHLAAPSQGDCSPRRSRGQTGLFYNSIQHNLQGQVLGDFGGNLLPGMGPNSYQHLGKFRFSTDFRGSLLKGRGIPCTLLRCAGRSRRFRRDKFRGIRPQHRTMSHKHDVLTILPTIAFCSGVSPQSVGLSISLRHNPLPRTCSDARTSCPTCIPLDTQAKSEDDASHCSNLAVFPSPPGLKRYVKDRGAG